MKNIYLILYLTLVFAQNPAEISLGFKGIYSPKEFDSIKHHHLDIYGSGLYSFAEFHLPHFSIVNSMFTTTDSLEAVKGGHKKVMGILGYTNQAYLNFRGSFSKLQIDGLVGRNYLKAGYGKVSSLFLSDASRPFDQVRLSLQYKDFISQMVGVQLENIDDNRRYLTVHTLQWHYKDKIKLQLGESILYSGSDRSVEWQFFNPMVFWTPEIVNTTTGDGNGLLYAAVSWYPKEGWNFWTELLIDDFQVNHESKGDLEPNEIGFLSGVEKTGWPIKSSDLWLEYTRITNRTYQTPNPAETYTHRGFPIGHYLGNDFDMVQLYYSQENMNGKLQPYISLGYLRDGANGLDTPFDTPWLDSTVTMGTGYSEPFPTDPITYVTEIELAADYHFRNDSFINAGIFYQRRNLQGKTEEDFSFILRLWFSLDKTFNY